MVVNRVPILALLMTILIVVHGAYAENPKLIWKKHIQGTMEDPDPNRWGTITVDCKISSVSLSKDGKVVGYKKEGNIPANCLSSFVVLDSYGTIKEVGDIGYDYKGFIWDNNTIVATKSHTKITTNVYYYTPNGTKIKDIKLDAKFSLTNLDVSPNGKFITFVDGNKDISIYDGDGHLMGTAIYERSGIISSSSISNNGEVVFFVSDVSNNKGVVILYKATGELVFKKEVEFSKGFVKISPDGQRIALGINNILKVFSGIIFLDNDGNELWRYNIWKSGRVKGTVNDLEVIYSGEYSVIFAHNKLIEMLDERGEQVGNYSLNKSADDVSVSEKGDYIIASSNIGYLYYFDNSANIKPTIVVLANSIDYELNSDLFGFLKNRGLLVTHATADNFDQYKNEKFIVILGGPDAYEGVSGIVREVLMNNEQNQMRENGSEIMYVKTNVWTHGQRVTVIAGSGRMETRSVVHDNRAQITVD